MAELILLRHGQASFGAADYDALSDMGRAQARAVGAWLRTSRWHPDRVLTGTLRRQRDTAAEMGFDTAETHAGFDEYDSGDLLARAPAPDGADRRAYFRHLRDVVHDWIEGRHAARESWPEFCARVSDALAAATRPGAARVLVVTSGGVVGRSVAATLAAPDRAMMALNLQVRNTALTRFVFSGDRITLTEFNALPHFSTPETARFVTHA